MKWKGRVLSKTKIHETAEVSESARVGDGTQIWNSCQIREGAQIGRECVFGRGVYIDFDVKIGDKVKIQNNASIFHGTIIEDGVFIGPHACLTNDMWPRAINRDGSLKGDNDWTESGVTIESGASLGAGAVICPGVTIGKFALVGAGSVVTKNVPSHALVYGNPAKVTGWVCACNKKLDKEEIINNYTCKKCINKENSK